MIFCALENLNTTYLSITIIWSDRQVLPEKKYNKTERLVSTANLVSMVTFFPEYFIS